MNNITKRGLFFVLMALSACLVAGRAWAQMGPADGHANEVSNVTTYVTMTASNPHSWYIGHTGTNNTLTIESAGMWRQNTWHNFAIGGDPGSDHNTVTILGTYTNTSNFGALSAYVGMDTNGMGGTHNRLLVDGGRFISSGSSRYYTLQVGGTASLVRVSNGGVMEIGSLYLGRQEGSASNLFEVTGEGTRVLLDGTGRGALEIGENGVDNHMVISGGASVTNTGSAYIGRSSTSSDNSATVSGTGSVWTAGGSGAYFYIGSAGANNTLTVEDNAKLTFTGDRFWLGGSAGADGNSVLVDGDGSELTADGPRFGSRGAGNLVRVTGGAKADFSGGAYLGWQTTAEDNSIQVAGTNSRVSLSSWLYMGSNADNVDHAGGGQTLLVHTGAYLEVGSTLLMGHNSPSNRMEVIGHGATAGLNSIIIGHTSRAYSNVLTVAEGASLTNKGIFYIGDDGSRNLMTIRDGGKVYTDGNMSVGHGGTQNRLDVSGDSSSVTVDGAMYVGLAAGAHESRVLVSDGGLASAGRVDVGYRANDNRLEVTGTGSRLTVTNTFLYIATHEGSGNVMEVREGGILDAGNVTAHIGIGATDTVHDNVLRIADGGTGTVNALEVGYRHYDNRLEVTGAGSHFTVNGSMTIGVSGGTYENVAQVSSGGVLQADGLVRIGGSTTAFSNRLQFVNGGTGVIHAIEVGAYGSQNDLEIIGPGSVVSITGGNDALMVGPNTTTSRSNTVLVAEGGRLELDGNTRIGRAGSHNAMRIESGGVVTNTSANALSIVVGSSGPLSELHIDGQGSMLGTAGGITVGLFDEQNTMIITNQGAAYADRLVMGDYYIWAGTLREGNNNLLVTGSGSLLDIAGDGHVGMNNTGNVFRVENGGRAVFDGLTVSRANRLATNAVGDVFYGHVHDNHAIISDPGSSLEAGSISVGGSYGAHSSSLRVEAGATVQSGNVTIGTDALSSNNWMTLTGAATAWTNTGVFFVSAGGGAGNLLQVHDGALLESDTIEVGAGGTLELSNVTVKVMAQDNPFVVHEGGTLRGTGTIEADVMSDSHYLVDGTVSPGFSTGTLEFAGDLTLGNDAVVVMQIAGDEDFDQVIVSDTGYGAYGNLALNGTLQLSLLGGYEPQLHDSFQLFSADSYLDLGMAIDDTEAQLPEGWMSWQLNEDGSVSVIPEAATTGTMLLGMALLAALRRRLRA